MHLPLTTILALLPIILASPLASQNINNAATSSIPKRAAPEVSILPIPNPPTPPTPISPPVPSTSATLQDLLAFCASGTVAANLPAVQQFCALISGIANTAGGISGGGGLGGGLGGIIPPLPPVPGVPVIPGLGGKGGLPV
ncbi:hypothetical protein ONS95_002577 [Cadophora gregata]|uniref:uncharacterized protein n=1 Tax=Cadophora gregata TaxID=51156 RepID=UPI0026DD8F7B|nr:uncharacterized protein ONS95_002577 [Cadophora gregata]KAK0109906.1 hypothetical protein ONS95_002577 [Cadophora gregata]KAK0110465.1 hypothetical protein ONS96_002076 [Cadophora gregata f. sp. sojae]